MKMNLMTFRFSYSKRELFQEEAGVMVREEAVVVGAEE